MKHVKKSVLLWYSPAEMYDLLVTGIPDYPKVPALVRARRGAEQHDAGMTARLPGLCRRAPRLHDAQHACRATPVMDLVDGPFSLLEGLWRSALGRRRRQGAQACKIEFDLRYAFFSSKALEAVVSRSSTASPTPSSIRSCAAPRQVYGAAERRGVIRAKLLQPARR